MEKSFSVGVIRSIVQREELQVVRAQTEQRSTEDSGFQLDIFVIASYIIALGILF